MSKQARYFFITLCFGLLTTWLINARQPAHGQNSFTFGSNSAEVDFPQSVAFELEYRSDRPIVAATLRFDVEKFACVDVATEVPVEVDDSGTLSWEWAMVRSGNPPTGTTLWWEWTLTDADGNQFTSERQTTTLDDTRFEWQTLTSERISLHWYRGDAVGPLLLASAEEALTRIEADTGIVLSDPVDIWVYGSASDMRDAILFVSDWAGGVAFTEYNTVLLGVTPSNADTWGVRVTAHELTHLVVGQWGRSCVGGDRPTWLEEGIAMWAEGEPENSTRFDIEDGIKDDDLEPIRSLTGAFPAHSSDAREAYSQSWSIVSYLLDQYDGEQMQALIERLAAGDSTDAALEAVYGFNMDGLETEWREHIAANPRDIRPTQTPLVADAIPTFEPVGSAAAVATPDNIQITEAPEGSGQQIIPFCSVGLILPFGLPLLLRPRRRREN